MTETLFAGRDDWGIVYLRPDGWWSAGTGFESEAEALEAAQEHNWRGSKWRVIPVKSYATELCADALEEQTDAW